MWSDAVKNIVTGPRSQAVRSPLMAPLIHALTWNGFAWLVAGGLVYTAGILFYLFDERFRHWHGIWHLFVMAGSAIHFFTILKFVA